MNMLTCIIIALTIDRIIGWPNWLFRRISHPVVLIGNLISVCEKTFNSENTTASIRRFWGIITVLIVTGVCLLAALFISSLIPDNRLGTILTSLLIWPWIAAKSLSEHVEKVALSLSKADSESARAAVSMIVGRNAKTLDDY